MFSFIALLLNLPWTIVGVLCALISVPKGVSLSKAVNQPAVIFRVKSLWWFAWLPNMRNVRAVALGNTVLLKGNADEKHVAHELVHVKQAQRQPLLFPILYWIEIFRHGYWKNKYEMEAYDRAKNFRVESK